MKYKNTYVAKEVTRRLNAQGYEVKYKDILDEIDLNCNDDIENVEIIFDSFLCELEY